MRARCINCNVIVCSLQFYEVKVLSPSIKKKLKKWLGTKVQNQYLICRPCYLLLHVNSDEKRALGHTVCFMCAFPLNDGDAQVVQDDHPILQECMPWNKPQESDFQNLVCNECWNNYNYQSESSDENKIKKEVVVDYDDFDANDTEYLENTIESDEHPAFEPVTLTPKQPKPLKRKRESSEYDHPLSTKADDNNSENEVIILPNYKRIIPTNKCIFSNCLNEKLTKIPNKVKRIMLHDFNYYIPLASKICEMHLNSDNWELLVTEDTMSYFTAEDVEYIFTVLNVSIDYNQDSDDGFNWD